MSRAAKELQQNYPLIHIHIVSGDRVSVIEQLDRGLIDFGLMFGEIDMHIVWKKYSVFTKAAEKFLLKMQEMAG